MYKNKKYLTDFINREVKDSKKKQFITTREQKLSLYRTGYIIATLAFLLIMGLFMAREAKQDKALMDVNYCTDMDSKHYLCNDEEFEMNKLLVREIV